MGRENSYDPCEDLDDGAGARNGNNAEDHDPNNTGDPPAPPEFPEAAFPEPERLPQGEMSSARQAVMIDQAHYYNYSSQNPASALRWPRHAYDSSVTPRVPDDHVDAFRYIAGAGLTMTRGNLRKFVRSLTPNESLGIPFDYKMTRSEKIGQHQYNTRSRLEFDSHIFDGLTKNNRKPPVEKMREYIYGVSFAAGNYRVGTQEKPIAGNLLGISEIGRTNWLQDTTFSAPAAFRLSEINGLETSIEDWVDIEVVSQGPSAQPWQGPLLKPSIYNDYGLTLVRYPERDPRSHPPPEDTHVTQKFSARQIEEISKINQVVLGRENSDYYARSQELMSNHVRLSFNMHHNSPIAERISSLHLDSYILNTLSTSFVDLSNPPEIGHYRDPATGQWVEVDNPDFQPPEKQYIQILDQITPGTATAGINDRVVREYLPMSLRPLEALRENFTLIVDGETRMLPAQAEFAAAGEYPIGDPRSGIPRTSNDLLASVVLNGLLLGLRSGIETKLVGKKRTFAGIISGEKCHSEVIAYRVEKRLASSGELIQNFYFFNDPGTNQLDFYDTQVMYGDVYLYRIYAINFVAGCRYQYSKASDLTPADKPGNHEITFDVLSEDHYMLVETPYHEREVMVSDYAPLFPEVEVFPIGRRNAAGEFVYIEEDKFNLTFTPRVGEVAEIPISILSSDEQTLGNMLANSPRQPEGMVVYRSDSPVEKYQIIMTDIEPLSYDDFSEATSQVIETSTTGKNISCEPNKDYYMIFRAIDSGGISNPSEVHKVRIDSFPDGRTLHFTIHEINQVVRQAMVTAESTISIEAAPEQAMVNYSGFDRRYLESADFWQSAPTADSLSLGISSSEEGLIWGKKFKFRIRSRTTGKAIDLNVTFNENKIPDIPDPHPTEGL